MLFMELPKGNQIIKGLGLLLKKHQISVLKATNWQLCALLIMGIYISIKEYNYKGSKFFFSFLIFFNVSLVLFDLDFNLAEIEKILINTDAYINVYIVSVLAGKTLLLRLIWIWGQHYTNY